MALSERAKRDVDARIKAYFKEHLRQHHNCAAPAPEPGTPVTPQPSVPETPPSTIPPENSITAIALGLKGDGSDETAALQRALDKLGDRILLLEPGKTYVHSDVLYMRAGHINGGGSRVGNDVVNAATIASTNPSRSAFRMYTGTSMTGVRLTSNATTRGVTNEEHKLTLNGDGIRVTAVLVDGSCGAGIYSEGASNYSITDVVVRNTLADSIHNTGGSFNGVIRNALISNSGDDGVAVVSYGGQSPCHHITATDIVVTSGNARGVSVVGGEDISYSRLDISNTGCAGIYISREPSYDTLASRRVTVDSFTIKGANWRTEVHHGSVLLYAEGGIVEDCVVRNGTVLAQAGAAPWHLAAFHAGAVRNCKLESIAVRDTARTLIWNPASVQTTNVGYQVV